MTNLNMAKLNMLIKKGYLLAGVVMAANMLVVNEVRAMENTDENDELKQKENKNNDGNAEDKDSLNSLFKNVLSCKNYINLIGGMASSGANNYFKWWNYNPGIYWSLGCYGWRSGRFLKDIFQFDINFNIGRGAGWMVLYILDFLKTKPEKENVIDLSSIKIEEKKEEDLIGKNIELGKAPKTDNFNFKNFIFSCAPGFISVPLAIHIYNFSIAVSLDSIIWELVTIAWKKKDKEEKEATDEEIISGETDNKKPPVPITST